MAYHCASVCTCLCVCVHALWWCPQASGFEAGRSADSPFSCQDPSLSFLRLSRCPFHIHCVSLCFFLWSQFCFFFFFLINKKEAKTVIPKLSGWPVACRRCQERVNLMHISLWELRWKFASFFSSVLGAQEIFIVLSRLNKDSLLGWLIISWYNEESTEGRSINNAPKVDLRSHCCCCWQPQIQRTQWDQNSNVYSV